MKKIFRLVEADLTQVVLKVNKLLLQDIARHPYISGDFAYITVTRGARHTLTVIRKGGTTFSFSWGEGGHTLISDNLERLRKEVISFIELENHIALEIDFPRCAIKKVETYYNKNFNRWMSSIFYRTDNRSGTVFIQYPNVDTKTQAEAELEKFISK